MMASTDWQCGKSLPECFGHLLKENIATDVTFLLGEEKVPVHAHKLILISRSPVFHAMLDGPVAEKGDIEIPDITKETFSLLLKYIYTDQVMLNTDIVLGLMAAARKYCIDLLIDECKLFVEKAINIRNVGNLLEEAHTYMDEEVMLICLGIIQENSEEFLQSESFTSLCPECVFRIIQADELSVLEEDEVFNAVIRWSTEECKRKNMEATDKNRRTVLGNILYEIRFPIMTDKFLVTEVCCGDMLSGEEIKTIFRMQHTQGTSEIFKSLPRTGRKHSRFLMFSEYCLPEVSYSDMAEHAIEFLVSRPGFLLGICVRLYMSAHVHFDKVELFDNKQNCLTQMHDVSFNCSTANTIFDVMLDKRVRLEKDAVYTINITTKNSQSLMRGKKGKIAVEIGSTTVQFFRHPESLFKNVIEDHIHGIIFG